MRDHFHLESGIENEVSIIEMGLFLKNSLVEKLNWIQILSLKQAPVSILKSIYKYDDTKSPYLNLRLTYSEEQIAYIL